MPYIVVLQQGNGTSNAEPFARAIEARDLDAALRKAQKLADTIGHDAVITTRVLAVFDALSGAIGPEVEREYD